MDRELLQQAWVAQAQADAERGIIQCRMCRQHAALDHAMTLWRNGVLVFAVCDRCARTCDITIRQTDEGIEVRGRSRGPIVLRSGT